MKIHQLSKLVTTLSLALTVYGCAVSKSMDVRHNDTSQLNKPTRVLIQAFSVDQTAVKGSSSPLAKLQDLTDDNHQKEAKQELMRDANDALYDELAERLKTLGYSTLKAPAAQRPKENEVMISGQFTAIDEGNAVRRAIVGFGAGQSSVDAAVRILASNNREILSMKAHADSGAAPGAAVTAGVGTAAQTGTAATAASSVARGGMKAYQSAISHQASQIADKIIEEFSSLAKQKGWDRK